ncbi:DUF3179 domain-containing (seleno)protein [Aliiruegeria lutimaris]|uniref:DUF3179 domain-containing protein n=1 Tax=Aliiruegeria lutimaris TaxID=571298 RepID=A0A1G9MS47_9RHOB|nr:DUF3179 domain-containing (seleno)protein [Aliiruegeria lutimaris]SDL76727.1 Protein of unknown function [Aliiruegeria lutimaris]
MEQTATIWTVLYWASLAASGYIGFIYFRDLGDVTQMVLKVKRKNMLWFIRNEYKIIFPGIAAGLFAAVLHLATGAGGSSVLFWILMAVLVIFYGFTWVWVHIGLRHQQDKATYYSIAEAKRYVAPEDSVIVIENKGHARAHPDYEIWRPHLAGNHQGLGGENVIITYCSMTHLGHGYKPEIDGEKLNLEVLAQHGNNLIMRDNNTGEPIQQMYGNRERDARDGPRMQEWPTFRMTFRGFEKAYPEGEVFLNRPSKNPLVWLVDFIVNSAFVVGLAKQYRREEPVMDNVEHIDRRLPLKTFVWGFNVGDDYTCYTEDFVKSAGVPINSQVGGRGIVAQYDNTFESLGIWYNDSGEPVSQIDFFGNSDKGKLERVETVKAGSFWHVWANFFPTTDINRPNSVGHSNEGAEVA